MVIVSKNKIRPLGDVLLDMEVLLDEAIEQHDLQWGDVLGLVHQWLVIHHPEAQEEYTDGTNPKYFYGSKK